MSGGIKPGLLFDSACEARPKRAEPGAKGVHSRGRRPGARLPVQSGFQESARAQKLARNLDKLPP